MKRSSISLFPQVSLWIRRATRPPPSQAHSLRTYLWRICFPGPFKWLPPYSVWQWSNFSIHAQFAALEIETDWSLIVCACGGLFFQRWKLMLSSWQHCHCTNRPDGAFKGAGFWEECVRLFYMLRTRRRLLLGPWSQRMCGLCVLHKLSNNIWISLRPHVEQSIKVWPQFSTGWKYFTFCLMFNHLVQDQ